MTLARLFLGDCRELLATLEAESVDAIVCDPPYELGFMGKAWDRSGVAFDAETWAACLRVAKPGAHLVAFGGTRTAHRLAVAIEDAGWEIRDSVAWCYWSGFPKSLDLGEGRGTAIKPAFEPAILARKPLRETSIARQVVATGTGALNIDACRFAPGDPMWPGPDDGELPTCHGESGVTGTSFALGARSPMQTAGQLLGRFPANLIHAPKASREERELGCEGLPVRTGAEAVDREEGSAGLQSPRAGTGRSADGVRNWHPTVKPLGLMRWLVRLVTPPGGVVLDPFMGSGTTGMAAVGQGFRFLGCELDADHLQIARARVEWASVHGVKCELDDPRPPALQPSLFGGT